MRQVIERFRENKLLRVGAAVIAALVLCILLLFLAVSLRGTWTKGGTDTKGPFRYRICRGNIIEVRVDISNLPEGDLVVKTDDSGSLQTTDRGIHGREHRYRIHVGKASYAQWQLALYATEKAQKADEALYGLFLSAGRKQNDTLYVSSISAQDASPVTHVKTKDCNYQYQLTDGVLTVQVHKPTDVQWYVEYDSKTVECGDIFSAQDGIYVTVAGIADNSFETDVTLYTLAYAEDADGNGTDVRDITVPLHVKGENGAVTGVSHE